MFVIENDNKVKIECNDVTFDTDLVSVYFGTEPTTTTVDKVFIGEFNVNEIEFDKVDSDKRVYYVVSDKTNNYVCAKRKIDLEGTFNTRDFGGYVNKDGRMIKWGVFYRSDALTKITENDIKVLTDLNIKTVVDFRGEEEIKKSPDILFNDVKYVNLPPHGAQIAQLASGSITNDEQKVAQLVELSKTEEGRKQLTSRLNDMEKQMRELVSTEVANQRYASYLDLILDESNTPILHHCMGGKDRAGFGAVVILMALNVSKETIVEDYMLTKQFMAERNVKRLNEYRVYTDNEFVLNYLSSLAQTQENYLEAAFDEIHKISGSWDKYLKDRLNMTDEKIAKLQEMYLV